MTLQSTLALLAFISCIVFSSIRGCAEIRFDADCAGHLALAADANTVERAGSELDIAIKYLESRNLTKGYTSVLYNTPDEDIGFWFSNIVDAREELNKITPETSQMERTNVLMKLRETLLSGKEGAVTVPSGISVYPANKAFWWWGLLSTLTLLVFGVWTIGAYESRH